MKTTVITLSNSNAYAIYVNGKKVIQCDSPMTTFNSIVKSMNLPTPIEVYSMTHFPEYIENENAPSESKEVSSDDIDFDTVNSKINFTAPKLGAYRAVVNDETPNVEEEYVESDESEETETASFEPVGNVEMPSLGDLIYVEGMDGMLAKIRGGVGTVGMVYDNEKAENCEQNILIELEEIPGHYFNWNQLADVQDELKAKYGYKPACKIV